MQAWRAAFPTARRTRRRSLPSRQSPPACSGACAASSPLAQVRFPRNRPPVAKWFSALAGIHTCERSLCLARHDGQGENDGMIDSSRAPSLSRIETQADLRKFDAADPPAIADELRPYLTHSVGKPSGHFCHGVSSNERTVALHGVHDPPQTGKSI